MATSSSKKIQRVQRAGVTKRAGDRPPLGFPLAVVAILILGSLGVYFARDARLSSNVDTPVANEDVWHAAFGIYVCDQYLDPLGASPEENNGIYSTGDGLIHIHPTGPETAGQNALLAQFFANTGLVVSDGSFTVGETTYSDGDTCGEGEDATTDTKVKLFVWPPQASTDTDPEIISSQVGGAPFREDAQIMALALVPSDVTQIDLPPTVDDLDSPDEEYGTPIEGLDSADATTSTIATTTTAG